MHANADYPSGKVRKDNFKSPETEQEAIPNRRFIFHFDKRHQDVLELCHWSGSENLCEVDIIFDVIYDAKKICEFLNVEIARIEDCWICYQ